MCFSCAQIVLQWVIHMRIAHLSDPHIFGNESPSLGQLLRGKRLLGGFNWVFQRRRHHLASLFEDMCADLRMQAPDHIAITGDLSNLGLLSEFRATQTLLQKIGIPSSQFSIIPGNHDAYVSDSVKNNLFFKVFSDCSAQSFDIFPFVHVREDVAFIGVNTAVVCPLVWAYGRIDAAQLDRLAQALHDHRDRRRVVLLHHPPLPCRHDGLRGLRDREALQAIVQQHGCELILHGHEHRDLFSTLPGPNEPIPVIGVGSATYSDPRADRRARYHMITLRTTPVDGNWIASVETRVQDPATQRFTTFSTKNI